MAEIDWGDEDVLECLERTPLETFAEELMRLQRQEKDTREKISILKTRLAAHFPEEPGDFVDAFGDFTVTMKRSETWTWDTTKLNTLYASVPLPTYVKKKLSIDKRSFQALDNDEKGDLLPALTRSPGAPRFTITEISGEE